MGRRENTAVQSDRLNARFAFALATPPRGSNARATGVRVRGDRVADRGPARHWEQHAVPCVILTLAQLRDLPLDSRDAYVLSLVDGSLTVESILDVAATPEDETRDILDRLLYLGAIGVHPPTSDF